MAYAEKVPSPKGDYWRGRYTTPAGKLETVRDEDGRPVRFSGQRKAKKAAEDEEAKIRAGRYRKPGSSLTFREWASRWHAGLELAESTMANRKRHLEQHLIPHFGDMEVKDGVITLEAIARWRDEKKAAGYEPASIASYRRTLSACLGAAAASPLVPGLTANPAIQPKGTGRRSGRRLEQQPQEERAFTSPSGMLLISERLAILTGRDDEFVMAQAMFWQALRLGEALGLERPFVRPSMVVVEWQLHEVEGRLLRIPPKDDSYGRPGTICSDAPPFLSAMLAAHLERVPPARCPCHGTVHAFRGGEGRGRNSGAPAAHWRRSSFERFFAAAASGQWPSHGKTQPARPVVVSGSGTWPGTRAKPGTGESRIPDALCWSPVAAGMTPHGVRHSLKSLMEERRIPEIASESRLRHGVPGVSGIYRHVTDGMRQELTGVLEEEWEKALDARLEISPRSPVAVLDGLLLERSEARRPRIVSSATPGGSSRVVSLPVFSQVGVPGLEPGTSSLSGKEPEKRTHDDVAGQSIMSAGPQVTCHGVRSSPVEFGGVQSDRTERATPGILQKADSRLTPGKDLEK